MFLYIAVIAIAIVGFGVSNEALAQVSTRGINPELHAGNFPSSGDDNQVCYDMFRLGYLEDLSGRQVIGIKVDPSGPFADPFLTTTVSPDGKFLSWIANNATVLAVIMKGGPNYNLYKYVETGFNDDGRLASPISKKNLPQISHYNFCYEKFEDDTDFAGCTRGYWGNHADRWADVAPSDDFDTTFGVDVFNPNITLGQAIKLNGGGIAQLAAQSTAALLNSHGGVPNTNGGAFVTPYQYTTAEIISMVQAAVNTEDDQLTPVNERDKAITDTKDLFDVANNAGCILSGTSACSKKNPGACL